MRLKTEEDLGSLDKLDQKLWATLSCPTHGLEFDSRTLDLIDTDRDGRIRAPEILACVKWVLSVLKYPSDLTKRASVLPLSAIDDTNPEGNRLLLSAKQILTNLGKPDATDITPEDTEDTVRIFADTVFNGDGIIVADSAEDESSRILIQEIIDCLGSEPDRSGKPGVSQEKVDLFFEEAQAYADWWAKAEDGNSEILLFGKSTVGAGDAFRAVRAKVDDYFVRCGLAQFDPGAATFLNPAPFEYEALARKDLSASVQEIAALPLATIKPGNLLPLCEGINPAWAGQMEKFRFEVVKLLLGEKLAMTSDEWALLSSRFRAYEQWGSERAGSSVEKLSLDRIRKILAGDGKAKITALIERDSALKQEADSIAMVDKLVRLHRDLFTLLNNYVSFHDFYCPGTRAIFQVGTLYIAGRSCDLCIRVEDIAKHSALAGQSQAYVAYCECKRDSGAEKMNIAVALTDGNAENLMVGRNGVFYDRRGRDWDATIVKIIEHPISMHEAFWSPYKRVARMVAEQLGKMAAAKDKQVTGSPATIVADTPKKADAAKPAAPAQPFDVGKFAGIFAAIGLAIGAIGTALASIITGVLTLKWWQIPMTFAGLMLFISGPSMIIAYLKLRKRNLAPILDANGWAINARAIINIPFGCTLTSLAHLPDGAQCSLQDPFAEKQRPWKAYVIALGVIILLGLVIWQTGLIDKCIKP